MKLSGVKVSDIVRVGDEHPPTHGFVVEVARGRLRIRPVCGAATHAPRWIKAVDVTEHWSRRGAGRDPT